MKCNSNNIKNIAGLMLINCSNPPATGLTPELESINEMISDRNLIPLRWFNPDSMAANNTDATIATDSAGKESVEAMPARIGFTAVLESVEGTLIKALQAKGSAKGYLIDRSGAIWGSMEMEEGKIMPVTVRVISVGLPNGISVSGTNLPAVNITVDLGYITEVADWRIYDITGAIDCDSYLIPEICDLVVNKIADLQYEVKGRNLLGETINFTDPSDCFTCSEETATWTASTITVTAVPFSLTQTKLVDGFQVSKETVIITE